MKLTPLENKILISPDVLLAKASVINKVWKLLEQTQSDLEKLNHENSMLLPKEIDLISGKISRGENYQQLPYLILDFPALFSKKDIFAYRTMFWWGHFFSFTLHLQGIYLEKYRQPLIQNASNISDLEVFFCVGRTPWQYHYEPDNYQRLSEIDLDHLKTCKFLKLSKKIDVDRWMDVPSTSCDFLKNCLSMLNDNKG